MAASRRSLNFSAFTPFDASTMAGGNAKDPQNQTKNEMQDAYLLFDAGVYVTAWARATNTDCSAIPIRSFPPGAIVNSMKFSETALTQRADDVLCF